MSGPERKFILAGIALVMALGLGFAWHEHRRTEEAIGAREAVTRAVERARMERNRLKNSLATATRDIAVRQAEIAKLERDGARAEENEKAKANASGSSGAANSHTRSVSESAAKLPKQADIWEQSIRRDPALQVLQIAADRARLAIEFDAFFKERGLTAEQVARFQEIKRKRQEAWADIGATVQGQDLAEDDPSIQRLRGAADDDYRKEVNELLGTGGFERMREYESGISLRNAVRGLAAAALDAGIPFSASQAEELARTVVATRSGQAGSSWNKPDWNAVDAAARGFLTMEQLALIQNVETNVHGAGGRFWSDLTYLLEVTRQKDFEAGQAGQTER
jgi:hypothetical protein